MEAANLSLSLANAETNLIIPKGVLNPNETTIIRIPARLYNAGPLLVVKDKKKDGATNYRVRKTLDILVEQPEDVMYLQEEDVRKNAAHAQQKPTVRKEDAELNRLFTGQKQPSRKSVTFPPRGPVYNKSSATERNFKNAPINTRRHEAAPVDSGTTNVFFTRPVSPQLSPCRIHGAVKEEHSRTEKSRNLRTLQKDKQNQLNCSKFGLSRPFSPAPGVTTKNSGKVKVDYLSTSYPSNFIKPPPDYYAYTMGRPLSNMYKEKSQQSTSINIKADANLEAIRSRLYNVPTKSRSASPAVAKSTTENLKIRTSSSPRSLNSFNLKSEFINDFDNCRHSYATVPVTIVG